MIRQAGAADWGELEANSEAAVKICGLWEAYGADQPFCRFWRWGQGGILASLEGAAVLYSGGEDDWEEMAAFLAMSPDIHSLRSDEGTARKLAEKLALPVAAGDVMSPARTFALAEQGAAKAVESPRELYPLLSACFSEGLPSFDGWYADVSHRLRHGCCRIAVVHENGRPIACAMTTAEGGGAALIGAVATHPDFRGRGYASACVAYLTALLQQERRQVFLSPKNEPAHRLYRRLGYVDTGRWGSLVKE